MISKRSRSDRRLKVKTPGGRVTIHYEHRKNSKAPCTQCGAVLHGVSHDRGLAASKRRPSRPYGGVLCSRCTRNTIKRMVISNA